MNDITSIINNHRECVRHLWNVYFRMPNPTMEQIDAAFRFDKIANLLFSDLVLNQIGKYGYERISDKEPWPFLKVEIRNNTQCPALINRPSSEGKYWDEPVNYFIGDGIDLRFIGYFDWDEYNYIDYKFYKIKILAYPQYPHLVGREALIETQNVRILFEDSVESCQVKGA